MSKNFDDLLSKLRVAETKKLSVAVAQDEPVLEAVKAAKDRGIADAILVGDKSKIKEVAAKIDMDLTDFEIIHEANHNEAMTIYDVLCYSKDRCHLSHEFININSLSSVRTGNLSTSSGFFQNTADFFNGKTVELRNACIALSGKELEKGDVAFKLNLFPFLPIIIRFWEADDEFPASLQILADRNTLDYMHYETLMFALTHLFSRLNEEMRNEKR